MQSASSDSPGLATESPSTTSLRIVGSGEMASLILSYPWERTVLGPIETWSDTLVITVNLLLASRHPMFLWWGPDLIQFYNDGYRPSIRGDKHPAAIGQRGVECWPEIWPIIGPQIEAVMTRGESTWNINQLVPIKRDGKLEEVFWTYSYSPVRDKDGAVQGTLVVCSETTEQVLSERRLRALLDLSADPTPDEDPQSPRLVASTRPLIRRLDQYSADIPFAALFLLKDGEVIQAGSTTSAGALAEPSHWRLDNISAAQVPVLLESLPESLGTVHRDPWPEPVTRAYLLPLTVAESAVQAIFVFGISPRLPFDHRYETFLQLVAARIATMVQEQFHQEERAQAAQRFRRLVEANPFGSIIGDLQGSVTYINPGFLEALGYSESEVNSGALRWESLTPREYADLDARAFEQLKKSGHCDVYEKAFIAKDGRRIPILIGAATLDSFTGGSQVAAFVTDLTPLKAAEEALRNATNQLEKKVAERTNALESEILDRKRMETSLRQLSGRLLRTQDDERRRLARDLHDHAGQTLVALSMNLAALQNVVRDRLPDAARLAAESQQLSDELSREIRTLSYLLHPPLLEEAGLGSALDWYIRGFSARSGVAVDLAFPPDLGRFSHELEIVLFRVVQECLTNIHRHSGSASAAIDLRRLERALLLEISDQGRGISAEKLREMNAAKVGVGVGVRGMEERVRQFNGTLTIDSTSAGTKVRVTLPLAESA